MRYLGLAALSAAVLLLELTLTRVYSVTQGYHFAFLAVSLGLLGFGASGTVLYAAPALWRRDRFHLLGASALLFGASAPAVYWAINTIPFDSYRLAVQPVMFLHLGLFYLVQVVPFFFAGLALGGALARQPGRAAGLYGASLAGSGLGALLALGGPSSWGPVGALGIVATLSTVAWVALAPTCRGSGRGRWGVAALAALLLAVGWLLPRAVELRVSPYRALPQLLRQQGAELVDTRWNAFSRVDVVTSDALHRAPGLSFAYQGSLPPQTAATVDADNMTVFTDAGIDEAGFAGYLPAAAAYGLHERPRVLVIEPGGGMDVLTALSLGAERVVALVSNPIEADLLREQFAGQIAARRVSVVVGNPRSYLERTDETFDLVELSLRDAFRPVTVGAYSLRESHLYTREAFRGYLERLAPGGILVATRWVQVPPSEELRLAATAIEALEDTGVPRADDRLAAIRTLQTFTLLIRNGAFTSGELERIRSFADSRRMDVSYLPGIAPAELNRHFVLPEEVYHAGITALLDPAQRQRFYEDQEFDITPVTDDRPFFFNFFRWRQVPDVRARIGKSWEPFAGAGFLVIVLFLGAAVVLSSLLILAPLIFVGRRRRSGRRAVTGVPRWVEMSVPRWAVLTYFFVLGLAFLWIELPLMQRFILLLDHPTYSFGVVLFAVLVFSGLGSLLSPRLGWRRPWAILALGVLAAVYAVVPVPPMDIVLGLPLAARVPVAIFTIAPLAILMGVPLPAAIAALGVRRPDLIPWAWGVNGYGSVIGAVLAALLALTWGFSRVMLLAGAGYLLAAALFFVVFSPPRPAGRRGPGPG